MLSLPAACCRLLRHGSTLPQNALLLPLAAFVCLTQARPAASGVDPQLPVPPASEPTAPAPASLAHLQQHAAYQRRLDEAGVHPAAAAALMRELHQSPRLATAVSPDALSANCRQLQLLYGPGAGTLIERFPRILLQPRGAVPQRISQLSALLHVTQQQATAVLLSLPELVRARPATLEAKVARLAELLSISPQQAGRIAAASPKLLVVSSRSLEHKLEHYSMLLSCSPAALRGLMCQQPRLLQSGTRLLDERVGQIADLFAIPVDQVLRVVRAYPALLDVPKGSMAAKLAGLASLLQTDAGTMKAAVLQNPRLLSLSLMSLSIKLDSLHHTVRTHPRWLQTWEAASVSVRLRALCASQAVLDRLQYVVAQGQQGAHSWTYLLVMPSKQFNQKFPGFREWHAARAGGGSEAGA